MKKLFIMIAMLVGTICVFSQEATEHKNSIGMNFSQLINSCFKMNYERFFANKNSLVVSAGITMRTSSSFQYVGGSGEVQYHFNAPMPVIFKKGMLYFAPYAGYQYLEYQTNNYYYGSNNFNTYRDYSNIFAGCLFGVRTNLTSRFFFDVNIGGGFRYELKNTSPIMYTSNIGTQQLGYSGVYPRTNVLLGINF
jgi:hypothetical protein